FRNHKLAWHTEVSKLSKVYGPVFTLWIGPLPFVFICDLDMGRQAFTKCEFSGRIDIKYAKSKALSEVVDENVRQMIDNITRDVAINTPFKPKLYSYNMFVNIMGDAMFSKKINNNQDVKMKIKYTITDFHTDLGALLFIYQFVPVLRYLMANPMAKYRQYFNDLMNYTRDIYQTHDKTHDCESLRDFCDILIAAKHKAIANEKQTAPYLTDDNLPAAMVDMLIGGTETTQTTFLWSLLFIAFYPDYQDKLRDEINNELGDCMPVIEDKSKLNYTMAFISEILRYKNPFPIGVPHKMLDDSKLGDFTVLKNTLIVFHQASVMTDPKYWTNADKFEPDRFLDNHGQFLKTKPTAYIPFSYGRRTCLGESLAINNLFLVLVRFIQLTNEYRMELYNDHDIQRTLDAFEPELDSVWLQMPKPYQIIFRSL
ncbi:unnamed protein product, partial [Medioppia subpectinata]